MPTYEFRCPQGHEFEKFYRSIGGAEALAACPQCGLPAERVMSAAGFAFKGSGFYLTDYGKNAHRDKGTPEPKSGAPAGEAGGDNGAKPEPKSDAGPSVPASASTAAEPRKGEATKEEAKKGEAKQGEARKADPKPASAPTKKSADE